LLHGGAWLLIALVCSGWQSAPASAQSLEASQAWQPVGDARGYLGIASTEPPGPWQLDAGLGLDLAAGGLDDGGVLVEGRIALRGAVQAGLGSRGARTLELPGLLLQEVERAGMELARVALGDARLGVRFRALGPMADSMGLTRDGFALGFALIGSAPTGGQDALAGEPLPWFRGEATGELQAFGIGGALRVGWQQRLRAVRLAGREVGGLLRVALGLRVRVELLGRLSLPGVREHLLAEVEAALVPGQPWSDGPSPVESRFGYRSTWRVLSLTLWGGLGLGAESLSPDLRAGVYLGWRPPGGDSDGDGIADAGDACVHLPEDVDQFEDLDGCPDPDNDQDMVLDEDDLCPLQPADEMRDEDEDGCTDA